MRALAGAAAESDLLHVEQIAVHYGGIIALKATSFSVGRGSLMLVLGPNGAGKSTLLKALAGSVSLHSGRVLLGGRDISGVPAHQRVKYGVALVPEGRGRLPGLSVKENLDLGWHAAAPERRGDYTAGTEEVLALFPPLHERLHQDCSTLSGGEMQMLAIARALLTKPILLLLDEPSLGLAPKAIARVYEALAQLNSAGLAMVLVEQKAVPLPARREATIVLQSGSVVFQQDRRPSADELAALYLGGRAAR
jgi:branched-chain amino acid transport system ATP-binding protein